MTGMTMSFVALKQIPPSIGNNLLSVQNGLHLPIDDSLYDVREDAMPIQSSHQCKVIDRSSNGMGG